MTKAGIKKQLHNLIDKETDENILIAIKTILEKKQLDPVLREKLSKRALRAEEDIQEGRTMDREEAFKRIDEFLSG